MFTKLIKKLFPLLDMTAESNVFYFEDSRKAAIEAEQETGEQFMANDPINMMTEDQRHMLAFYDCLFGQSSQNQQPDELSQFVSERLETLLSKPAALLKSLPILPTSLTQVLAAIDGDDFDVEKLVAMIEQEPAIAAKVIELANSSFYKRGSKAVTSLKSAFMGLGRDGLVEGVVNGFISKMTPQSKVYFKQYGYKIWRHSLSTGLISKKLIGASSLKEHSAEGYLVGLICNLGDMIIYQLMIDAFAVVHPDCQPDSWAFKNLMITHSRKLTCQMAKYWHFPEDIVKALLVQDKLNDHRVLPKWFTEYPLACYVFEANLLSELEFRYLDKQFDAQTLSQTGQQMLHSQEALDYLAELAQLPTI
jgi:HD-like signal output (HDOD) protein